MITDNWHVVLKIINSFKKLSSGAFEHTFYKGSLKLA